MKNLYETTVHVVGGRNGAAHSSDGKLDVDMALPPTLGGSGKGTNPEQLFAAGFAGCFTSSLQAAAQTTGVTLGTHSVSATVTLGATEDGRYGLSAALRIFAPDLAAEERDLVVAEARRICAYTNATKGNVETIYHIVEAPAQHLVPTP